MDKSRKDAVEDLLCRIWMEKESGNSFSCGESPVASNYSDDELIADLQSNGLVNNMELTEKGEQKASKIVRRLRLAERLYSDLLQGEEDKSAKFACRFEHILNSEVTDSVCTLLGHPPTCPHGKRIPRGDCCQRLEKDLHSLVKPLTDFAPGATARIVFISPSFHNRLDRLNSFGVLPGAEISLHQKTPTFVIRLGATEIALEKEVAGEIFAIGIN
jgi:DtxR family transcriptional regulator, Mn-dependent transcriptional regulator